MLFLFFNLFSVLVFSQSEFVKSGLRPPPENSVPTLATARINRDLLMTVLLIGGAGRPSHITGLQAKDVATARVSFFFISSMFRVKFDLFRPIC